MKRTVLLLALAVAATLLLGGAAWAATLSFAPAKTYPAGAGPVAVGTGDLDGDRESDLVTADADADTVSVLIRRHDGTLRAPRAYAAGDYPADVIAREDLDGDGDRDLAVANSGSADVSVRLGRGDGTFRAQRRYATGSGKPSAIESGDLDGDGDKDLVTANPGPGTVSVFSNSGGGAFAPARDFVAGRPFEPGSLDSSDLDGDGDEDLVVTLANIRGADGGFAVLLNGGGDAFGEPQRYEGTLTSPADIVAGDLDGDGDNDLAAADPIDGVTVFGNRGDGTFEVSGSYYVEGGQDSPSASEPVALTKADFDRDGDVDIATANGRTDNVSVLTNAGDGTFGPYGSARVFGAAGDLPLDIARARMNGDRKPDLVVANSGSDDVSVLVNMTR